MRLFNIFIISISQIQQALADIDMLDASYFKTWTDHKIARDRRDFKIRRTYKSRSLHNGYFGFGWCSDLEKRLLFEGPILKLEHCSHVATDYQLTDQVYIGRHKFSGVISKTSNGFIRRVNGKTIEKFDLTGRLISVHASDRLAAGTSPADVMSYNISYDQENRPIKLSFGEGEVALIKYNHLNYIKEISLPQQISLNYVYNQGHLLKVNKNNSLMYEYKYDSMSNLIHSRNSRNEIESQTYDTSSDRVLSTQDSQGCIQNLTFSSDELTESRVVQVTTLKMKCPNAPQTVKQFTFWLRKSNTQTAEIEKIKISSGESITEVTYGQKSAKTLEVKTSQPSRAAAFINSEKEVLRELRSTNP